MTHTTKYLADTNSNTIPYRYSRGSGDSTKMCLTNKKRNHGITQILRL